MKKIFIIFAFVVLSSSVAFMMVKIEEGSQTKQKKELTSKDVKRQTDINVGKKAMVKDHSKENINCKECHTCEYPTHQDPCLVACPRTDVSVYHSPDEAPDVIDLNNLTNRYGSVVFSHKIHASMSVMSHGCVGCHHYNTTGPVLKCSKCHESKRIRKDLSKPDLEAAFHRQCMTCHRQWQRTTDCNSCHLPKGKEGDEKRQQEIAQVKAFVHPAIPEPVKVVYQTNATKGKIVTFFHEEHIKLFNIQCVNCHRDENCIKCHDVNLVALSGNGNLYKKIKKSFDEHHQPCINCHESSNCSKCHANNEMQSFSHSKTTGWELGKFHAQLKCQDCHVNGFKHKLNNSCSNCHNDFKPGKFNHEKTGLKLSENHVEVDCKDCHSSADFRTKFECLTCHDDKNYPKFLPGKKLK